MAILGWLKIMKLWQIIFMNFEEFQFFANKK